MKALTKLLSSPAILYVGGAIAILLIVKSILPKGKTKSERDAEAALQKQIDEIKNSGVIWSTKFWQGFPAKAYSEDQAKNLAGHIWNAFGTLNDDEAKIYGVFRTIKYQTNVSQIADEYAQQHARDLHSDLEDRLSTSEMEKVYEIISLKPL